MRIADPVVLIKTVGLGTSDPMLDTCSETVALTVIPGGHSYRRQAMRPLHKMQPLFSPYQFPSGLVIHLTERCDVPTA